MDRLMYRALGPLTVVQGSRVCSLGGFRQRMVLAVLLANCNRVISQEALVDAVWNGDPPPAARNSLHSYISNLRRELGTTEIARLGNGYRLAVNHDSFDALQFQMLTERGHAAFASDPKGAALALNEALRLWKGPPFADLGNHPALVAEVTRLNELRLSAEEDRIEAHLLLGEHQRLVAELQVLVNENPYRERFQAQLMLALYRSGRQAEALRVFKDSHRRLADDLGIDPSAELWRLEDLILRHDPSLAAPIDAGIKKHEARSATGSSTDGSRSVGDGDRPDRPNQSAGRRVHGADKRPISRIRRRVLALVLLGGIAAAAAIVDVGSPGLLPAWSSSAEGCAAPPPDLTAWWTGDYTTEDEIGGRVARLVNGATFDVGAVNEAFALDGSGAFVEISDHHAIDAGRKDFAVDLWVSFNDTTGVQVLVEKWMQASEGTSMGWTLSKMEDNSFGFFQEGSGRKSPGVASSMINIPLDTWLHIAALRRGNTIAILVDGTLQAVHVGDVTVDVDSESSLKFGHRGGRDDTPGVEVDQGLNLNGKIDEVHLIIGRALTDQEIRSIFDAGANGLCHPTSA